MVAGESIVTDTNKCQLKPLRRADYGSVTFTDTELARLQKVFPSGVCDFSKPGVDGDLRTLPWLSYDGAADGVYGGRPLRTVPAPDGLSSSAFQAVGGTTELQGALAR
jgi:hypothetical protein